MHVTNARTRALGESLSHTRPTPSVTEIIVYDDPPATSPLHSCLIISSHHALNNSATEPRRQKESELKKRRQQGSFRSVNSVEMLPLKGPAWRSAHFTDETSRSIGRETTLPRGHFFNLPHNANQPFVMSWNAQPPLWNHTRLFFSSHRLGRIKDPFSNRKLRPSLFACQPLRVVCFANLRPMILITI